MEESSEQLHIKDLGITTWESLCKLLDVDLGIGNNYKHLAGHAGLTQRDLDQISRASQPTYTVLQWWGQKLRATVPELLDILIKMGREDCVKILKKDPLFAKSGAEKLRDELDIARFLDYLDAWVEVFRLQHLKESTHQKLLTELATEFNPPQKKFIKFAEALGYKRGDVNKFLKSQNPVSSLLGDYEVNGENNVFRLMETLERIGRRDLVEMLRKEAEEFFERKRKDQERAKKRKAGHAEESVKRKKKREKKVKKITA